MFPTKETVLTALQKDIYRRYISVVPLQADGRLQLDSVCTAVLNPKPGEKFYLINDNSSIIIVRKPIPEHKNKIINTIKFDSYTKRFKHKWRLRLPQTALRILLTCKVGFRAFRYGSEIALEAEPYIPSGRDNIKYVESLEELGPFVLRSSRSILHIECISPEQRFQVSELGFRLLGEYWIRRYHQDYLDPDLKLLRCSGKICSYCESSLPIVKTIYWFPVVGYHFQQHYARPALISFKMPATESVCADLVEECWEWKRFAELNIPNAEKYCSRGIVQYHGKGLWKIASEGKINISKVREDEGLTTEEKGLMKIALKELEQFIDEVDGIITTK